MLKIIKKCTKSPLDQLYAYQTRDVVHYFELSPRIAQIIVDGLKDKELLEKELNLIEKYNVTLLDFLDEDYPEALMHIYHPPLVLYCKGEALCEGKNIAIVGSRKADRYAQQCIDKLVPPLVQNNWTIISGGATGVDTMAHKKTIEAGGKTIVIFGTGLMHPYPVANKELFRSIVRTGGTLVSPFPMQTPPSKGNFPARNRIISGLSQGCIVVQAAHKSGALITSQFALDQGKPVFAIPGSITNELSLGCHKIIQQGAKLVNNIDDVLEEYGLNPSIKESHNQTTIISDPLLAHLEQPTSLDELYSKTGIDMLDLQNKLFTLQLEGKVRLNFAGLWELV